VAGQFVAIGGDPADQRRLPLRHPAEGEERRLHPSGIELIKNPIGIAIDRVWTRI
jgi:hypothetical protein